MVGLTSLPLELLSQISQDVMPEGFESFALASKTTYAASKIHIEKHHQLRAYRNFRFRPEDTLSPRTYAYCSSSLELLYRIAQEPLIAAYIRSADLKLDQVHGYISEARSIQIKESPEFFSLLERSPYLQKHNVDVASFIDQIIGNPEDDAQYCREAAALFLCSLLINATDISIPQYWNELNQEYNFEKTFGFDLLADIVERASCSSQPAGLSKLSYILPTDSWDYETKYELSSFNSFLMIPSVKGFCGASCVAVDDGYTGDPYNLPPNSSMLSPNLEVVELVGSVYDAKEISVFLSVVPNIRSLKLNYETKWHGCGHDMEVAAIFNAIEKEVGGKLEVFSFSIYECFGDITDGIKSFKEFWNLRVLEIDIEMLGDPPLKLQSKPQKLSLASMLPLTLQKLILVVKDVRDNASNNSQPVLPTHSLNALFSNAAVEIKEKLPKLKEILILNSQYWTRNEQNETSLDEYHDAGEYIAQDFLNEAIERWHAGKDQPPVDEDWPQAGGDQPFTNDWSKNINSSRTTMDNEDEEWRKELIAMSTYVNIRFLMTEHGARYTLPCFMRNWFDRHQMGLGDDEDEYEGEDGNGGGGNSGDESARGGNGEAEE